MPSFGIADEEMNDGEVHTERPRCDEGPTRISSSSSGLPIARESRLDPASTGGKRTKEEEDMVKKARLQLRDYEKMMKTDHVQGSLQTIGCNAKSINKIETLMELSSPHSAPQTR